MFNTFMTIFTPVFLIFVLGMCAGILVEDYKNSTDELFFLENCTTNNNGKYDEQVISQCKVAFQIYKDKR